MAPTSTSTAPTCAASAESAVFTTPVRSNGRSPSQSDCAGHMRAQAGRGHVDLAPRRWPSSPCPRPDRRIDRRAQAAATRRSPRLTGLSDVPETLTVARCDGAKVAALCAFGRRDAGDPRGERVVLDVGRGVERLCSRRIRDRAGDAPAAAPARAGSRRRAAGRPGTAPGRSRDPRADRGRRASSGRPSTAAAISGRRRGPETLPCTSSGPVAMVGHSNRRVHDSAGTSLRGEICAGSCRDRGRSAPWPARGWGRSRRSNSVTLHGVGIDRRLGRGCGPSADRPTASHASNATSVRIRRNVRLSTASPVRSPDAPFERRFELEAGQPQPVAKDGGRRSAQRQASRDRPVAIVAEAAAREEPALEAERAIGEPIDDRSSRDRERTWRRCARRTRGSRRGAVRRAVAATSCRAGLRADPHPSPASALRTCRRRSSPAPRERRLATRQTGSSRPLRRRRPATVIEAWLVSVLDHARWPVPSPHPPATRSARRDSVMPLVARPPVASKFCTGRLRQLMFVPGQPDVRERAARRPPMAS